MNIIILLSPDNLSSMSNNLLLSDNTEGIRRLAQTLETANNVLVSWAVNHGGSTISVSNDEICLSLPSDYLSELPKIKQQYEDFTRLTLSVGLGLKISEATRSLQVSKLKNKGAITFYTNDVDHILQEAREVIANSLTKKEPILGQDQELNTYKPHQETIDPSIKLKQLEDYGSFKVFLVDGPKIRHTLDMDFTTGGNAGRYKYVPEGEIWVDNNINPSEIQETIEHEAVEAKNMESKGQDYETAHDNSNRELEKEADNKADKEGGFKDEKHPDKQTSASKLSESGSNLSPEEQFHEHAKKHDLVDQEEDDTETEQLVQIKQQLVQSLQILKEQAPMLEQIRQQSPQA